MGTESYPYLDVQALTGIRTMHRKNLAILTDQASKFGELHVPVHIKNQIASEIAAVDAVNQELGRRGVSSDDPQPGSDLGTIINHYHGTTFVGNRGVAIGGNADNAQISTGDNNRLVRDTQGYIENARNVQQDFSKRDVHTDGGDYAERDLSTTTPGAPDHSGHASLRMLIERVQAAATEAQQSRDEELGDSLQTAVIYLRDARRKVVEAQKTLQGLSTNHTVLAPLVEMVTQMIEQ